MTAKIEVRFYALLRRRLGKRSLEIASDGLTVLELLLLVEKQMGHPFLDELLDREKGLLAGTMILVNGENIRLRDKLQTLVHGGDAIDLFSPAGGG